jgi:hypothetical protein
LTPKVICPLHLEQQNVISSLHRVEENTLHALSNEMFLKLRASSALPLAYAQILSEAMVGLFASSTSFHQASKASVVDSLPESLDSLFQLPTGETVKLY